MSTGIWRWILAPKTSWAAWKLYRAGDSTIDFDVAWRQVRLRRHPDEIEFRSASTTVTTGYPRSSPSATLPARPRNSDERLGVSPRYAEAVKAAPGSSTSHPVNLLFW